jgi:hypothetical protein
VAMLLLVITSCRRAHVATPVIDDTTATVIEIETFTLETGLGTLDNRQQPSYPHIDG